MLSQASRPFGNRTAHVVSRCFLPHVRCAGKCLHGPAYKSASRQPLAGSLYAHKRKNPLHPLKRILPSMLFSHHTLPCVMTCCLVVTPLLSAGTGKNLTPRKYVWHLSYDIGVKSHDDDLACKNRRMTLDAARHGESSGGAFTGAREFRRNGAIRISLRRGSHRVSDLIQLCYRRI